MHLVKASWLARVFAVSVALCLSTAGAPARADQQDFNANLTSDVLLRHSGDGRWRAFLTANLGVASTNSLGMYLSGDWSHQANADFDNDGDADVLLRHTDGSWRLFEIQNGAVLTSGNLTGLWQNTDWEFRAAADMDGDGDEDLLLRRTTGTPEWRVFEVQNGAVVSNTKAELYATSQWYLQALSDFDGDGDADALLRRADTGQWAIFNTVDGTPRKPGISPGPLYSDVTWAFSGAGDMNNDGVSDLVLRNRTTGAWRAFAVANRSVTTSFNLGVYTDASWGFRLMGDFDADGDDDLLLRQTVSGNWRMFEIQNYAVMSSAAASLWKNANYEVRALPLALPSQLPQISNVADQTLVAGETLNLTITATDADGPGPLVLTLPASSPALPSAATFTDNGDGTASIVWNTSAGEVGVYTVTVRATDNGGVGGFVEETFTITVNANTPPDLATIADQTVAARNNLAFNVTATDGDGPAPLTLTLLSSVPPLPGGANFTDNGGGSGSFDWTPANGDEGAYVVTIRATDGVGGTDDEAFTLTVNDNLPPVLQQPADEQAIRGGTVSFTVTATDADGPGGIDLALQSSSPALPGGANFTDNGNGTGSFSWATVAGDIGVYTVTFRATDEDGTGEFSEVTMMIYVYSTGGDTVVVPFLDDFADSNLTGWTVVDDSPATSNWTTVGTEAQQTNAVNSSTTLVETYQLGTNLTLNNGAALTDYTLLAELEFMDEANQRDVGVLFRYQNATNYYRLAFNSYLGYTRLEKQVAGTFSTLAVNSRGYTRDQVLNVAVTVSGSTIFVRLDGDLIFAVTDTSLASGSVGLYTNHWSRYDNVTIHPVTTLPDVGLSAPNAYDVSSSTTIDASALALNVPAGGRVDFVLNGSTTVSDTTAPFSASFVGVSAGSHTVEAILRDSGGTEVARDTNMRVGAGGEAFLAVGDSITAGFGDVVYSDNLSASGRIITAQGFESTLTDLLDANGSENIVYNEGIGGDHAFDGAFDRYDSIVARRTSFDTVLLMYGTNDAGASTPSGLGCSGAACNGTFKGNMQTLIDKFRWVDYPTNTVPSGVQILVAEPPASFFGADPWTSTWNNNLRGYNTVIQTELTGITVGPGFFDYFMESASSNRETMYRDTLHPNSLGYEVMAVMWRNVLRTPIALPFTLDDLVSSASTDPKQDLMEPGNVYTRDEDYTITSIPAILNDGRWILVDDADFGNTSSSYLTFDVDRTVDVYVAVDGGATSLPNWMAGFTSTGQTIGTTNPSSLAHDVYVRTYSPGTITLGGASATGAGGINANMIVVVVED